MYILKVGVRDGFCSIVFQPGDAPKQALVFPKTTEDKQLVSILLTPLMIWKKFSSVLCTAIETVAYLSNEAIHDHRHAQIHAMDV